MNSTIDFKDQNVIVGLGQTGQSLARYYELQGQPYVIWDTREHPTHYEQFKKAFPNRPLYLGDLPSNALIKSKQLIISPGVPLTHPVIKQAQQEGVKISSDINIFLKSISSQVVGITGSNGKSTVTHLVTEMAKRAGRRAWYAGNVGIPVMDLWQQHAPFKQDDIVVLELSSFQLERGDPLPLNISVILNVTPDHLDRYTHFDEYQSAKHQIHQQSKIRLYNRQDTATIPNLSILKHVRSFGLDAPKQRYDWGIVANEHGERCIAQGTQILMPIHQLKLIGEHNVLNALSALAIGSCLDLPYEAMKDTLARFAGLPHRCQRILYKNNIDWINDSKATNPGSCLAALEGLVPHLNGKIVLILGGVTKEANFNVLTDIVKKHVSNLVLLGLDTTQLWDIFHSIVPCFKVTSMKEAVKRCADLARPGDRVLLAPACASFDLFQHFEDRGEQFVQYVNTLIGAERCD